MTTCRRKGALKGLARDEIHRYGFLRETETEAAATTEINPSINVRVTAAEGRYPIRQIWRRSESGLEHRPEIYHECRTWPGPVPDPHGRSYDAATGCGCLMPVVSRRLGASRQAGSKGTYGPARASWQFADVVGFCRYGIRDHLLSCSNSGMGH